METTGHEEEAKFQKKAQQQIPPTPARPRMRQDE
jgi:hypothetical protein